MTRTRLGIIGGSGLYDLPSLIGVEEHAVETPWGNPSDTVRTGRIGDLEVAFLARHGRGHAHAPSGINYRANIDALKRAGVTDLLCFSAVGSYREHLPPGHFVIPDQLVDRTFRRETSFFGNGCVAHVPFAHPVCEHLARLVSEAAGATSIAHQNGGTAVCMEGPQFSTIAESLAYRAQGFDIIGMTSMPEAKLAREAELPYCMVAMVTDFDAWHPDHDAVDVQMVIKQMHTNTENARRLIETVAARMPRTPGASPARTALDGAIMTARAQRDPDLVAKLAAVAGRVLSR